MDYLIAGTAAMLIAGLPAGAEVISTFDALKNGADCKVSFTKDSVDFCGTTLDAAGITGWSFADASGCAITFAGAPSDPKYDYTIFGSSPTGREHVEIRYINANASRKFRSFFGAWTGKQPASGEAAERSC